MAKKNRIPPTDGNGNPVVKSDRDAQGNLIKRNYATDGNGKPIRNWQAEGVIGLPQAPTPGQLPAFGEMTPEPQEARIGLPQDEDKKEGTNGGA